MSHAWCHRHPGILRMAVHVQPGARVSTVIGEIGGALKIRLHAPPVNGKANDALIAFVAEKLGINSVVCVSCADKRIGINCSTSTLRCRWKKQARYCFDTIALTLFLRRQSRDLPEAERRQPGRTFRIGSQILYGSDLRLRPVSGHDFDRPDWLS